MARGLLELFRRLAKAAPGGDERDYLVPVRKTVQGKGKVYAQTYWVVPEKAPGVRSHVARGGTAEPKGGTFSVSLAPSQEDAYARALAKLLRKLGVGELRDGLYLRWHPKGHFRTVLEAHRVGSELKLYLTHYREEGEDLTLDAELVFGINRQGKARLEEVAYTDPLGRERRLPPTVPGAKELARAMLVNLWGTPTEERGFFANDPNTL